MWFGAALLGLLMLACCFLLPVILRDRPSSARWKAGALAAWTIAVPLYFFMEYHYLPPTMYGDSKKLEQYKFGKENAERLWLAIVAVLAVYYFPDRLPQLGSSRPIVPREGTAGGSG